MKKKGLAPLRRAKWLTEILSLIIMIIYVVYFAAVLAHYPESGEVTTNDFFGLTIDNGRASLFLPFIISAAVMGLMFIVYRYPRLYRYPQEITADNIEYQYLMAKIMLNSEIIVSSAFFSFVITDMYLNAVGKSDPAFVPLVVTSVAVAAGIYITYLIKATKKRTNQKDPV